MKDFMSMPLNNNNNFPAPGVNKNNAESMQLTATFEDYEIVDDGVRPKFVLYQIRLHNLLVDYKIKRRFSDFEKLDTVLRQTSTHLTIPKLPSKFMFKNFEATKLKIRIERLETYLNEILIDFDFNDPDPYLRDFIELKTNELLKIGDVNQSNYLFRTKADFFYVQLIYQSEQFSDELEELKSCLISSQPSIQTVKLIFNGKNSIQSIFHFAFGTREIDSKSGYNYATKSMQSSSQIGIQKKIDPIAQKKMSFNDKIKREFSQMFTKVECQIPEKINNEFHLKCSTVTSFILELLDYARNPYAQMFRNVFCEMNIENFEQTNITKHLSCAEFTKCKMNLYDLLKIYKDISKSSRQNNECLLFPENEEYKNFCNWYNSQSNSMQKENCLLDNCRSFPKIKDIISRENIQKEPLFKAMDYYMDKQNINCITHDESNKMTKCCFLINESNKNKMIELFMTFEWNPNVLKIYRRDPENVRVPSFNTSLLNLFYVLSIRPTQDPRRIYIALMKVHYIESSSRWIYVMSPTDISKEQFNEIKTEYLKTPDLDPGTKLTFELQELDLGIFLDIEKSKKVEGKLIVSIILHYSFLDKRNESLYSYFQYLTGRTKDFMKFVLKSGF